MEADYVPDYVFADLFLQMKPINALALRISLSTGLRIGDVLKIKWQDITGSLLKVTAQKTKKTAYFELAQDVLYDIDRICPYGEYLFPGKGKSGHRTRQAVFIDLRNAARALKILEHATPHSARKTYAVGLRKAGATETDIQKALQHSSKGITKIYSRSDKMNITPERLDELIEIIVTRVTERLKNGEQ